MNKIYKVIWSRCVSAFVVVSEIAGSSARGAARTEATVTSHKNANAYHGRRGLVFSSLTALSASLVLVFGLSNITMAQVSATYGDPDLVGADVQITDWDNALTITGAGSGEVVIENGVFSVKPGATPRPDAAPYAGVRVQKGTGSDDRARLTGNSTVDVEGANLHGVYVESGAWIRSLYSVINAKGADVTGISVENGSSEGGFQLSGGTIDVSGTNAKGIYIGGGIGAFDDSATIKVQGNNAIGIDVSGGSFSANNMTASMDLIVTGYAGSNATGMRMSSGGDQVFKAVNITVQGAQDGLNTTGIQVDGATAAAGGGHHFMLGDGSTVAERTYITVTGGTHANSFARGIDIQGQDIQTFLGNTEISVTSGMEGRATGVWMNGQTDLSTTGDVKLSVAGYNAYGFDLQGDNRLSLTQGTVVDVAGIGEWITGIESWVGSHISLSGVNVGVESTVSASPAYTFGTARGVHARESTVHITDGSQISVASEYMAYGIQTIGSEVLLNNVTVSAESDQTARTLFFSEADTVTVEGSHLTAKGPDARVVTLSEGTLEMSQTVLAAENAQNAIGIYGSQSDMTLNEVNVTVEADLVATGLIAESSSTLVLRGSDIDVTGQGGSTVGISSLDSDVTVESTDITVKGLGFGWRSNHDTQVQITDSRITILGDGTVTAVQLVGTQNARIQGATTSLSATSQDVESTATVLFANSGALVELQDVQLAASVLDDRSFAVGSSVWGSGRISFLHTQIHADGALGTGLGVEVEDAGSQVQLASGTVLKANGEISAMGMRVQNRGAAEVIDSSIRVDGNNEAIGVLARGATVTMTNATLEANAAGNTWGILGDASAITLNASDIQADGGRATAVELVNGSLTTSGGTTLGSSRVGIALLGASQASLTHTSITSTDSSLEAIQAGNATQKIDLGAGVVATQNNGRLLRVRRDPNALTGRVEFNITDGANVSGRIVDDASDLSTLTATGGTFLTLDNAQYSGTVRNVRDIRVSNGASMGGGTVTTPNTVLENVSVDNATFAGNWQIAGTLQAGNGGRIAPGNSIGVITTNAIQWGPGTIYEVEVNAAGDSDRVDVTGPAAADISQTALHVMQEDGTGGYRLDHDYTIMTAAGGVQGQFTETKWLGSELIYVKPIYQAGLVSMSLTVNPQSLAQANLTSNQRAASLGALSVAGMNAAADAAFLSLNPAAAFDQLSGEIHPSTKAGLIRSSMWLPNAILGRLGDPQAGAKLTSDRGYPLWLAYEYGEQQTNGDGNTDKRHHKMNSVALGVEVPLASDWRIGGAFAYTDSDIKLNARRSSADVDSYSLALYAGKDWAQGANALRLKAGVGHTWHSIGTTRYVDVGGAQSLKANYGARTTQLFGEVGYGVAVGTRSMVEPYVGLAWLSHHSDGFSESGGAAALKGKSGTDDVTFSTLGLRAKTTLETAQTIWTISGGVGWRHMFGENQPATQMSFIQGGSDSFAIVGAPLAKNTAVFNIGAEIQVGRSTSIGVSYVGQAGSSFMENAGNLYLKARF